MRFETGDCEKTGGCVENQEPRAKNQDKWVREIHLISSWFLDPGSWFFIWASPAW